MNTKVIGLMIRFKILVFANGKTVVSIKAISIRGECMGMAFINGFRVEFIKEVLSIISNRDMVNIFTQMVYHTRVNGRTTFNMGKESFIIQNLNPN